MKKHGELRKLLEKTRGMAVCPSCGSLMKTHYICLKCSYDPISTGQRSLGIIVFCKNCVHFFVDAFRPSKKPGYTQVFICPFCEHEIELM